MSVFGLARPKTDMYRTYAVASFCRQDATFLPTLRQAQKVQGFTLQKALSVFFIAPFIGTLLPMPWKLLMGLSRRTGHLRFYGHCKTEPPTPGLCSRQG